MKMLKPKHVSKGELLNVAVKHVSLLFDDMNPANQKGFVVKSADGKQLKLLAGSTKFKSVTAGTQGRLYVTLMEPGVRDAQGDFYSEEEIVKACDAFSKGGMVGRNDINHNMHPVNDFYVAETYILKGRDNDHFPDTKLGAWVQVLKCDDLASELWRKVEKGQFNGVSIYGRADELVDTQDTRAQVEALKAQVEELKKGVSDPTTRQSIERMQTELESVAKSTEGVVAKEALERIDRGLQQLDITLNKAISKSIQGEPSTPEPTDREVIIDGQKVVVKASHREIYKGIAQLDAGTPMNILQDNTSSLFLDTVINQAMGDTLTDITVVPLIKDEKIDKGLLDALVFVNEEDGPPTAQDVQTGDISCPTSVLNARFSLKQTTVEFYKDKYGDEAFGAYVEQGIASRTGEALCDLLFQGDRTSTTPSLKALNGVVKLATAASAVTNLSKATYPTWDERLEAALLAFSNKALAKQASFVIYVSTRNLLRIRSELGKRETVEGDRLLFAGGKITFSGVPLKGRFMDDDTIIVGLPKYIVIGYRSDAVMKAEHHGEDFKYHWFIRIRPGITYVSDFVKVFKQVA
jgi:hypothetical protein